MINSLLLTLKLKNTYLVNSIIYTLKHTPLIKKIFSYSLYKNNFLKILINILSIIIKIISIFLGKILYILFCFLLIIPIYQNNSLAFINIFVFLTIIGAFINTNIFNPSIDKYYAIVLMKFDAKKYILCNYYYFLLGMLIGFLPFTILFGLQYNVNFLICILIPIFVINVKNITNAYILSSYKKTNKVLNENKFIPSVILTVVILFGLAYGLPYFNLGIDENIFYILFIISTILGVICFVYINKFNLYKKVAKKLLKKDELIPQNNMYDKSYKKQINDVKIVENNKKGYEYFNYIFNKRHEKLLSKASKIISIVLFILYVLLILFCLFFPYKNSEINNILTNYLPYYLFVLYFINRGQRICQTMFMNCDHSMLSYRFYRQPEAILSLFKERLKTLIKLNIIPGLIISIGTVLLLFVTGGTNIFIYIITFFTIIAMSIFFSIHYLVLYYLLQPYSVNLEIKNPAFTTVCGFTYFACYIASRVQIPTMIFGIIFCIFTISYSFLALYLVYKYALKTFKLKV